MYCTFGLEVDNAVNITISFPGANIRDLADVEHKIIKSELHSASPVAPPSLNAPSFDHFPLIIGSAAALRALSTIIVTYLKKNERNKVVVTMPDRRQIVIEGLSANKTESILGRALKLRTHKIRGS